MEQNRASRRTGESPAVRVYTICDESRYIIVRNVPALNCVEELLSLFSTCGAIEAYRRLDEECEEFTEIYWIKFVDIVAARVAKRTFDDYKFFSNLLSVSYAPKYETVDDAKEKLEERRAAVLDRKSVLQTKDSSEQETQYLPEELQDPLLSAFVPACTVQKASSAFGNREPLFENLQPEPQFPESVTYVAYNQHFEDPSMNQTAQSVREKLHKVSQVAPPFRKHFLETGNSANPSFKRNKNDGRRRI